jgi:hypothetical protein
MLAMGLIAILAIVDKLNPVPTLKAAPATAPAAETPSGAAGGMYWVDTGASQIAGRYPPSTKDKIKAPIKRT